MKIKNIIMLSLLSCCTLQISVASFHPYLDSPSNSFDSTSSCSSLSTAKSDKKSSKFVQNLSNICASAEEYEDPWRVCMDHVFIAMISKFEEKKKEKLRLDRQKRRSFSQVQDLADRVNNKNGMKYEKL